MKNHWLELHRIKSRKIWTAEFSKNSLFKLKPRKVSVQSSHFNRGLLGQGSGRISVSFAGALLNNADHELFDFLSECSQGGMRDIISRLKRYSLVSTQDIEITYELAGLEYEDLGTGSSADDLQLGFKFKSVTQIISA